MKRLGRKFSYNNLELEDIPGLTPEEVMVEYSNVYPELTQAVVEGPEYTEDAQVFTFRRAVGTKGSDDSNSSIAEHLLYAFGIDGEPILPPADSIEMI